MNEVQVANQLRGSFDEAVLLSINEQGGQVSHDQLEEFAGDAMAASETTQTLENLDLLTNSSPRTMTGDVTLSAFGRRVAARIRESMTYGARRADAVQRKLLAWLDNSQVRPSSVQDFLQTADAIAWGVPITTRDVSEATDLLIARGYIRTSDVDQFTGLQPRITPNGRAALQSDVMINEYGTAHPTAISYDYSHNLTFGNHAQVGGVISGGQDNVQLVEQTIGADVRSSLADQLVNLIKVADQLPDETPGAQETREALAEISNELAKPNARTGVIKGLTLKAFTAAAAAAGTAGGQLLIDGLGHLVKTLGS